MVIPSGKRLYINQNGSNVTGDIPMIIDNEIMFSLSSQFNPLMGGGDGKILTVVGSISKELFNKGFSSQFAQLGVQVWEKTDPFSISLTVSFYMDKTKPDAYLQVFKPTMQLARLTLPTVGEHGGLTAPGPTFLSSLKGEKVGKSGEVISLQIGKILSMRSVIVKKAEPTFSTEVDEQGYPISSKVSLEIQSIQTANTSMFPLDKI